MKNNPIIAGNNPDPSICRKGDTYYIAVSTFELFPGIALYQSTDLDEWSFVGYALTRESQLDLSSSRNSGGVYAPTLRYHNKKFYLIFTNTSIPGNYIVTASDITGPWSDPLFVAPNGIDPSLFWENDDALFYCSNGKIDGKRGIIGFYIDEKTGKPLTEATLISPGCGGPAVEGPHIFKKDGYYYLLTAEGGTEYGHHECIARAKCITGPYTHAENPVILSHQNRKNFPIQGTGHADFFIDKEGNWKAVFLGFRNFGHPLLHNLGRETFIAPVEWTDEGWPLVGNNGTIEMGENMLHPRESHTTIPFDDHFLSSGIEAVRQFRTENYDLHASLHQLRITDTKKDPLFPSLLLLRQTSFQQIFSTSAQVGSAAEGYGITAFYNSDYHYDLVIEGTSLCLYSTVHAITALVEKKVLSANTGDEVQLTIHADTKGYRFSYGEGQEEAWFTTQLPIAGLCTEGTMYMTFTGVMFGLFAIGGTATFSNGLSVSCPVLA